MGGRGFTSFVIFAGMRTGSNLLENYINQMPGLTCYGELFNPVFVGAEGKEKRCGVTLVERERDPGLLLDAIRRKTPDGVPGFRFFHNHDARVLVRVLADPLCAKVVLSRNPLDSYISERIARRTNVWRQTGAGPADPVRVTFSAEDFARHMDDWDRFHAELRRALQTSGQTAYYIGYEELGDPEVVNGLGAYLGATDQLKRLNTPLRKQNPAAPSEKVTNPTEMERALAEMDPFRLSRLPEFEPRRGAGVPSYLAGAQVPLLFMPVLGGPVGPVTDWLSRHDTAAGAGTGGLETAFNQKLLRRWKRRHPGHLSFTVLRHPVARLHDTFCRHILPVDDGPYGEIREALREVFDLPIPEDGPYAGYDLAAHRRAVMAFLGFLKASLTSRTGMRVDPAWASQSALLQGMAQVMPPDHVLREETLAASLGHLETLTGLAAQPLVAEPEPGPFALTDIYDAEMEKAARDVYARDYVMLGFADWAG